VKRLVFWTVLAASLSANVAVAGVALWQRRAAPQGEPILFSRIELDEGQRARISQLRSQLLASRDEHAHRMVMLRRGLAAAVLRQPRDQPAVENALRSIAEAQASYQRAVVEHVLAVRDVLRPEQQPAFEKMVGEHMMTAGGMEHCAGCSLRPHE
jgi:Spy/CpxP family protein refolding chaperone